jgi:signal peptidase I
MDFAFIMLVALVATGVIWAADRLLLAAGRERTAEALTRAGEPPAAVERARREPVLVEYARAFFPVILVVFLLRAFLVEPFRIPSGSMLPSLLIGDFILVNKYRYGLRLPVLNRKVIEVDSPKRGDVMVFRFPGDESINYIKRVVGLPGDHIVYRDRKLYINGQLMTQAPVDAYEYSEPGQPRIPAQRYRETLNGVVHDILLSETADTTPLEFTVPEAQYFVMGDNRDRSNDSRYWGTVPEQNIVGKAFLIWFSWDFSNGGGVIWKRIGNAIN